MKFPIKRIRIQKMWIGKLAYLADIFSRLNNLDSSLEDYCIKLFTVCNKTFKKVFFSNRCLQKNDIDMFLSLQDVVASTSVDTKKVIFEHESSFKINL